MEVRSIWHHPVSHKVLQLMISVDGQIITLGGGKEAFRQRVNKYVCYMNTNEEADEKNIYLLLIWS